MVLLPKLIEPEQSWIWMGEENTPSEWVTFKKSIPHMHKDKRLLVIQEHDAEVAGLHWDVRFEHHIGSTTQYDEMRPDTPEPTSSTTQRVLRSLVIPKHRFPLPKEKLLVIGVEDHPWEYQDFEGEIPYGYGKGHVKLLYKENVPVEVYEKNKIVFTYKGERYKISSASWMGVPNRYLITQL